MIYLSTFQLYFVVQVAERHCANTDILQRLVGRLDNYSPLRRNDRSSCQRPLYCGSGIKMEGYAP